MNEKYQVLVVEDNPADADLARETLPETGLVSFGVEFAPRLSDAIERLKRGGFDLVIVDLGLPDSQGLATFQRIRDAAPHVATIVLTGNADLEQAISAVREGAQDYLVKGQVGSGVLHRTARYAVERKRMEAALKNTQRLLSETERLGKVGGWEFDIDTRSMTWTEELCRIHEVDPDYQPVVDEGIDFYAPTSRPTIKRAVQRAIDHGEPFDLELEIVTAKGNLRCVHVIGRAELGKRRVYGFFQDITERKRAEEQARASQAETQRLLEQSEHSRRVLLSVVEDLKASEEALLESEEIFSYFMEMSPVYVFFKDMDLRALRLSRNYETMLGKPVAELLGKSMDELFPSALSRSIVADDRRILAEGKPVTVEEEFNGRSYTTIKFPILIAGKPRFLAGYTIDITENLRVAEEKTRLEDQLRQAQKVEAIGRLAGGVAHDFNNLTAIVLGYGEMLLGQLGAQDPARNAVEQIVAAGRRSATLTRQLLAFSRKQTLQPEALELNALLRNLEKMLGRVIGEDIQLEFVLAADLGRVMADPGQLEQVVVNLAVNARDAMPGGGRLTVETTNVELDETYVLGHESVVPGKYVMLALTDTGCGMDKAAMDKLFEPFYTTKEKGKGTGLGLSTVYGIVKQSGGYIWAYSEPGRGTSFKIYLPRTEAEPEVKPAETGGVSLRGGGERILLVEDERSLRELCASVLLRLGYRVSAAASGPEALRLVERERLELDMVLTDVIMPGMSGVELADRLRQERPGLKVLYMSGYPDEAIARHGVLDAGTPFIQKPFAERDLAAKLRAVLGGKAAGVAPGRRILMIDDDEQFIDLAGSFCRKRGHVFAGVDSAAAALAALAGQSFDVLLVDLNIPGTSGEEVLRKIRAAGYTAPAIVLTGDIASADMDLLRPLGVVHALEKSSDPEPLLRTIDEAVACTDNPTGP